MSHLIPEIKEGDYFLNVGRGSFRGEVYRLIHGVGNQYFLANLVGNGVSHGSPEPMESIVLTIQEKIQDGILKKINPKFTLSEGLS